MRSSVIWSFLSLVALATGGLVTGCDSDATITKSGEGESCDSSADCTDGYKCFQGACYKSAGPDTGEGGSDDPGVGPTPPVLGGEGESCTRAADCEEGLGCFNNRCVADPTGEGGAANDPVRLGQLNEACRVTADCAAGLACRINPLSPLVSVCTAAGGALEATGKSCNGAECIEAADCCQLPVELHQPYAAVVVVGVPGVPYGTGAKSCAELADLIDGVNCATATGANSVKCFAHAAYCECDDTWSCSEAGTCVYEGACDSAADTADVVDGCPSFSRSGRNIYSTCNDDVCKPAVVAITGCTNDASCEGEAVADDPADLCAPDECTCVKDQKSCYRKCNNDLDCPGATVGPPATGALVCDMDLSVCVPADSCTTNESCVRRLRDANAVCLEGVCQPSCATDYDCNAGIITGNAGYTQICNVNKVCEPMGCDENNECAPTANGVKLFCTAPAAPAAGGLRSAITD